MLQTFLWCIFMCFQQFRYLTFCPTISESSSDHFVILRYGDVEMLMCSLPGGNATRPYLGKWQYYHPVIFRPSRLSELRIVGTAWIYTGEMSEMSSAHQPVIDAITWPERIWTHFGNVCTCSSITSLFFLFGCKHSSFKRFPIRHTMICSDVTIRVLIRKLSLERRYIYLCESVALGTTAIRKSWFALYFPSNPLFTSTNSLSVHQHAKLSNAFLIRPPAMHSRVILISKASKKHPAFGDLYISGVQGRRLA